MSNKPVKKKQPTRAELRAQRLKKERQQRLILILGIGAFVVVAAVAIIVINYFNSPARIPIVQVSPTTPPQPDRNSMVDPNAPVKIVEYSDYQCPLCKRFADETEQLIVDNYVATGKVYFIYRSMDNFISDNIRLGKTESRDSSMAAYCAADQGMFWEYKDSLFANWMGEDVGSFTIKRLTAMAESIGLDMDQFKNCLKSGKYFDQVKQDGLDGQAAGINGTPSFFINGELLLGAQPYETFQQAIEAALKAAGQ
jgi:protein-disulfide isomerase